MSIPDFTHRTPPERNTWVEVSREALPIEAIMEWAVDSRCGALVSFSGTVRDHSEGRPDVAVLEYEAYEEYVIPKFMEIADLMFKRWNQVHKVAIFHRLGRMSVRESSVFIAVSAEHRDSAFEAAKFCIDTLKSAVPIWKKEQWSGGSDWGSDPHDIQSVEEL